jgi:hypothetical protein
LHAERQTGGRRRKTKLVGAFRYLMRKPLKVGISTYVSALLRHATKEVMRVLINSLSVRANLAHRVVQI